jgi:hypothetical protein
VDFWKRLFTTILVVWMILVILMLPVYIVRKRKNPDDSENTIKKLLIKAFIVCSIMVLLLYSGLIAMYFDDLR